MFILVNSVNGPLQIRQARERSIFAATKRGVISFQGNGTETRKMYLTNRPTFLSNIFFLSKKKHNSCYRTTDDLQSLSESRHKFNWTPATL